MQQFFHQHFAHESSGAGNENVTAAEEIRYGAGRAGHFGVVGTLTGKKIPPRNKTDEYQNQLFEICLPERVGVGGQIRDG